MRAVGTSAKHGGKPLTVGRATVTVAAGQRLEATFALSARGAALLRRERHLELRATITISVVGEPSLRATVNTTFRISQPKARKRGTG